MQYVYLTFVNKSAHSIICDAHRQSIDLLAWHPSGNLLASASHDCILKFWCREPAGSKLEPPLNESVQDNPPTYLYGPLPANTMCHAKVLGQTALQNVPGATKNNMLNGASRGTSKFFRPPPSTSEPSKKRPREF